MSNDLSLRQPKVHQPILITHHNTHCADLLPTLLFSLLNQRPYSRGIPPKFFLHCFQSTLQGLFGRFNEQFGTGPGLGPGSGSCLVSLDGVSSQLIKSLYKAAAALYRTDPWKRLKPRHLLGIRVGKESEWECEKQPFPCIQFIGGDGGDLALYLFRSENDALKVTRPRKTLKVPNVEILRVTYEREPIMFPSHRKMISSLALEPSGTEHFPVFDVVSCNSNGELRFRNPVFEELRFVSAVMKAVSLVHPLLQEDKEINTAVELPHLLCFEPFIETVDVQWSPELVKNGNDFVAVAVSHPPGHSYQERGFSSSASSTPTKHREPMEALGDVGCCAMCDKEFDRDQQQSVYCRGCSSPFLS